MNPLLKVVGLCLLALMGLFRPLKAQQKVFVLEMRDEVHASAARYISKGFEAAQAAKADLVILHLDTYGGRVDYADSIRGAILKAKMPTAVFIDRNAGSAGALISIACDSIYMAPGASIGAATVVNEDGEAAIDKYQSYWRAVMRATAEVNGRNPKIAEKMVDQNLEIEGLSPRGQVITFTNQDAITNGYCEGTKNNVAEVAGAFGFSNPQFVYYEFETVDKVVNFLIHPTVSAILLVLIFGGMFLELKSPGHGLSGVVALIAAFLFFVPHYIDGIAESWEIAVFILGVILIAMEIFVIPGFGVTGILGIVLVVVGIAAAMLENRGVNFDHVTLPDLLRTVAMVLVMLSTAILLVVWLAKYIFATKASYPYVDQSVQDKAEGYTALRNDILALVGVEGEAATDLRPVGFIHIDGKRFDAQAKEGYISKGQKVIVDRVTSVHLIVRKLLAE